MSTNSEGRSGRFNRRQFLNATSGIAATAMIGIAARPAQGGSAMSDPSRLGVVDLARAIRAKDVSCREVMQACLARIEAENPTYNAIVSLQDPEKLMAAADAADRALSQGRELGALHGIPQAPKDLTATAGIPTTQGSAILRDYVPKTDSVIVERARREGAILIGKTNTPEFGLGSHTYNAVFGTTVNALDPRLSAGGSSGGAAVALARHMLPVADGSDMMGSLRNPAGWNNVVGFRPTQGLVPYAPTGEVFVQQLGYEGPMGRTVADTAYLLSVQAGYDARAPLSLDIDGRQFRDGLSRDVKGMRIGWLGDLGGHLPTEAGVLETCRKALGHFTALGCEVEEARIDHDMDALWQTWLTLRSFTIAGVARPLYENEAARAQMKPEAIWEIEMGLKLSGTDIYAASAARSAFHQAMLAAFQRHDFLVLPTAQIFPFDAKLDWPKEIAGRSMDSYHRWMEVVIPATLAGTPVAAVPAGFGPRGASQPMGLQIIGPRRADLAVLQIAHAYEQASGFPGQLPG